MKPIEVHKFNGACLRSAEHILLCIERIAEACKDTEVVIVVAAIAGVTDALDQAAQLAAARSREESLAHIRVLRDTHLALLERLGDSSREKVAADLSAIADEIGELVNSVSALGPVSAHTRDRILAAGEKMSARVLASALSAQGMRAEALDADRFLETDAAFGRAQPMPHVADRAVQAVLGPRLERGVLPVVTGSCGRGPDGSTTTFGRGGSDLSATFLGAAMGAARVTIWIDGQGIYNADPALVSEARVIPQLNYREAAEMSFYGVKLLHPHSMIPAAAHGIPVRVANLNHPHEGGTLVDGSFTPGSHPVKAITAVCGHHLVSLEGKGMSGVPGVAARLFAALAKKGISVTMISQSSSESSICFAVPSPHAREAEMVLRKEFQGDFCNGQLDEIEVSAEIALIAAVGLGMANSPGVAARVFTALGRRRINILAIAQGSSELNITLAVEAPQLQEALQAIHQEFGMHRLDVGDESPRRLDILMLGIGKIGQALLDLIAASNAHALREIGRDARIVAIADRSGFVLDTRGLGAQALAGIIAHKRALGALAGLPGAIPGQALQMVQRALTYRLVRPILVDVSDADCPHEAFLEALKLGCHLVTANKKPLSGPLAQFGELLDEVYRNKRLLKAEATVGAGLPVMDTLEMLLATGDRVESLEGCLSGTLAYVLSRVEKGDLFSESVARARELGYTEPDPVTDLSGVDVGRKALILGRLSGLALQEDCMTLQGLVEPALAGKPFSVLLGELKKLDPFIQSRVSAARAQGAVLRYLARVTPGSITIGPAEVPADSALGMLRGTDNMIVFSSQRYRARPLVISGPGAGVEVTAMGVMGDILRIATTRR